MGQKKIKIIDLSEEKSKVKSQKLKTKTLDQTVDESNIDSKQKKDADAKGAKKKALKKQKKTKQKKARSKRYKKLKLKFDREKFYPPIEAISLLMILANSKIDETVEIHLSTHKDKLTGAVNFPHGTGKKQKVIIATNKLIDRVKNGKIDFDILIASPQMMGKIAKVAKILGPKGLMPNPKSGTISDKPEELKKKLEKGETRFKTEPKAPLIHQTIGKISFGEKKLFENLNALIKAVEVKNIKKAVLTSTHSPGIKLSL